MRFKVFHQGLLGRHDIIAVDMIHYSGLWGMCFSHHLPNNNHPRYAADTTTAGVLRFLGDTLGRGDETTFRALADYTITTHHFDADALLPVWALLNPQAALERRDLLERVARCGDFFIYLDDVSAKLNFIVEAMLQRLSRADERGDRVLNAPLTHRCFESLLPRWQNLLDDPAGGADLWQQPLREMLADLEYLAAPDRVTELWDRHMSVVETDHALDFHALNTVCRNDLLLVWRRDTPERHIHVRPAIGWYIVPSLPHQPHYDLAALAHHLNAAEGAADHPAWQYDPGPARVRTTASSLGQNAVLDIVKRWFDAAPEARVPMAYRADVREVFCRLPQHISHTSATRFAAATEVRFALGMPYAGLHLMPGFRLQIEGHGSELRGDLLPIPGPLSSLHDAPIPFAVSDDFYWNQHQPTPLELQVTYNDCGAGSFWIEYDTWCDPFQPTAPVALHGSGATLTTVFRLDNARLGNSQDGGDLRLTRTPGTALDIRELVLSKLEN